MQWNAPIVVGGVIVVYLVITVFIGWYWGRKTKQTEESYYVADRSASWIPDSMSMLATLMSGGIWLGTIALFWTNGVNFMGYAFAYTFTALLIWLIGNRLWRAAKTNGWTTQHDFYATYYQSGILRWLAAILAIAFIVPYFASNAVALGITLQTFVGVPYFWGVVILLAVGGAYTLYGGMRAVLYTDVFQGAITLGFGIPCAIALVAAAGGLGAVLDANAQANLSVFRPVTIDVYGLFIGWIFFMALHPVSLADRVTRLYVVRSVKQLRTSAIMIGVLLLLMCLFFLLVALATKVLVPAIPTGGTADDIVPQAILKFAPALIPLMVLAVWASGMSTLDSGLIGADVIFVKDLFRKYIRKEATDQQVVMVGRIFMVACLLLALWIGVARPPLIWSLISVAVTYFIQYIPLTIAALYWRRATKLGAESGWLVGVIVGTIFQFALFGIKPFWSLPAGVIALVPNVILLVVVSYLTKPIPKEHQDKFYAIWESPFTDEEMERVPAARPIRPMAGAEE